MSVPDTNTFNLIDVKNAEWGADYTFPISLSLAFSNSNPSYFDSRYSGSKNSLLNFRNYNSGPEVVIDYDGNVYPVVNIGTQKWLQNDWRCTHLNDGTVIPYFNYPANFNLTSFAYTLTGWDSNYKYYNAGVISHINFCPPGWHVPTLSDLNILADYLGGGTVAGGKMKLSKADGDQSSQNGGWLDPNTGADNSSKFYAHATGFVSGTVWNLGGRNMYFWLSDPPVSGQWKAGVLSYNNAELQQGPVLAQYGIPVRLVHD